MVKIRFLIHPHAIFLLEVVFMKVPIKFLFLMT